jgi:hypothetical protein
MPGAPTVVSKGRLIQAIDARLSSPRREYLEELEKGLPLLDIGTGAGIVNTPQLEQHVKAEAFGSWWQAFPLRAEIVRCGYIHALRVALAPTKRQPPDPPKPIVTYWVTGLKEFELMVAESKQQVTVFWLTPDPPPRPLPPPPDDVLEDLWVIAPEPRISEIRSYFPENYHIGDAQSLLGEIKAQRVKGY